MPLKIEHCQRCQEPDVAFILSNGDRLCAKCAKSSIRYSTASDNHFRDKIHHVTKINLDCHLGMIIAQIMAFYITNGMSVRQVARQLGIQHATIYRRLKKAGLMKNLTPTDVILNPTIGDFAQAGGLGKEFIVIQATDNVKISKNSVTSISAGDNQDLNLPGKRIGSKSNARKD